jgi:hypothetical protein
MPAMGVDTLSPENQIDLSRGDGRRPILGLDDADADKNAHRERDLL